MASTENCFAVEARIAALEGEAQVFERAWSRSFPRDHM
jgi:hypothetical protein